MRTLTGYYDKIEERITELKKSVDTMYLGMVNVKQAATACFPFQDMEDVEKFACRGDMMPLRLRLTSVPYKGVRAYPTDLLTSIMDRSLIAFDYTWPSPQ